MAVVQNTNDGPFDDGERDDGVEHSTVEREIDILGCTVEGCDYTAPSIHCLYSHANNSHYDGDGEEGLKQRKLVELFNQMGKDAREYRSTVELSMPYSSR